jgi:hypothetical protein
MVEKMLLWFELIGPRQTNGQPFWVRRKFSCKLSSHKNAVLLPFLNSWNGKPLTPEEIKTFHIVNLAGKACYVTIALSTPDTTGTQWANIAGIEPNRDAIEPSGLYSRRPVKARTVQQQPQLPQQQQQTVQQMAQQLAQQMFQQMVQQAAPAAQPATDSAPAPSAPLAQPTATVTPPAAQAGAAQPAGDKSGFLF